MCGFHINKGGERELQWRGGGVERIAMEAGIHGEWGEREDWGRGGCCEESVKKGEDADMRPACHSAWWAEPEAEHREAGYPYLLNK